MSVERIKNLKDFEVKFNQGIDEPSSVTSPPIGKFVTLNNWRLSDDGERIEKRNGVTQIVGQDTLGNKKVFGYHTYYDATPAFCQLVIAEDKVWRKVGSGAWTAIHTWASTLDHPVKPIEIQGKQIVITEIENFQIMADGNKRNFGITAPATAPTMTASSTNPSLDEDCAGITDWTDADEGSGESTQTTFDTKSCFKFATTGPSGDIAKRTRTISGLSDIFTLEIGVYFDAIGAYQDTQHFKITLYNGRIKTMISLAKGGIYFYNDTEWQPPDNLMVSAKWDIEEDRWYTFKIIVNSSDTTNEYAEVYIDGNYMGKASCVNKDTTNPGLIEFALYGEGAANIVYFDYIKIYPPTLDHLNGIYRYAITYRRSGNYPCESNPLKAIVGSETFTGSGLDDMTPGGTYTGDKDKTIRVQIDGTGTPDTMKWSDDDGITWKSTLMALSTTMYLPFGIELTWGATTGHTSGDYWEFTCDSLSVDAINQKVTFASIPVSSDGQVTQRRIYRTVAGGATYFLLATINDNTTTAFVDNIPDAMLGIEMSEDNDVPPLGKYATWWDDRFWIADDKENIVYYSKTAVPDAFDTNDRYISARRGESKERILSIKDFKSYLYIMKRKSSLFVRKRLDGSYGRYEVSKSVGIIAPWSIEEVYGLLNMFTFKGWEQFNGTDTYPEIFSMPLMATQRTVDKTKVDYIMTVHLTLKNEIWLSLPDRKDGASAVTLVCNYLRGKFYTFSFSKVPSYIGTAIDSSGEEQVIMGTRDGYVGTCESGTQDFGTDITATARIAWVRFPIYMNFPQFEVEYECPTGKNILVDPYVNFQSASKGQRTLAGSTPSATDQSIRLPIKKELDTAIRGKYLALKFTNNENVGSTVKLNWFRTFYAPLPRKGEIKGD